MLAVWTFFNPAILAHACRFVQQLQLARPSKRRAGDPTAAKTGTDGYLGLGRVKLSQARVQDLRDHLNSLGLLYDAKGNDMVPIIKQRHGDMVHVPAGHMHQVENLEDCVKTAWDKYVAANMTRYALSWLYVTRQVTGGADYMGAAVVVKNAIIELSKDRKYSSFGQGNN